MDRLSKILIVLGFVAFIAYVINLSLGLQQFSCRVCMEFKGKTACALAAGSSQEEATRTATDTACAKIASGVTDSIACTRNVPKSSDCKKR